MYRHFLHRQQRILSFVLIWLIAVMMLLSFTSCSSSEETVFFAMDTVISMKATGKNSKEALQKAQDEIKYLEDTLSKTISTSDISLLNQKKEASSDLSEDTVYLLSLAKEISEQSGGAFDPTLGNLTDLWDFHREDPIVPTEDQISSALSRSGYSDLVIAENSISLQNGIQLDLGGIAKGYAAQKATEVLKEREISSAVLSLGGNVCVIGTNEGKPWKVGIADPENTSSSLGYLEVSDTSIVTSGSYQRYFEKDGISYHHLLDPKTGYPVDNGLKSVTVVYPDSAVADGLSTAFFVLGTDGFESLLSYYPDAGVVFITEQNEIICTQNLSEKFTMTSSEYQLSFWNNR